MADPKSNELMEKIVSLCKRKGFIFQSSEIYGGINGFWDYGPLGTELKRNVKYLWWNAMTRFRDDVVGLDATIIMHPKIWEASGHVETFADMMRSCPITKKLVRADQVEPQSGIAYRYTGASETYIAPELLNELLNLSGNSARPTFVSKQDTEPFVRGIVAELSKKHNLVLPDLSGLDLQRLFIAVADLAVLSKDTSLAAFGAAANKISFSLKTVFEPFAVLSGPGMPPEKARKTAIQFYEKKGIQWPYLLDERTEKIEKSGDFHPESRAELTKPRPFNLMFKTHYGPIESDENVAYLRPETAQAIFAQFKNVVDSSRQAPPFGIAQIGKAFRNEITPRNFTFRSREFEQMELEFFIKPDEAVEAITGSVTTVPETAHPGEPQPTWGWQAWHQYWVEERVRFYESIGLSRETLGFHRQTAAELAHYARACVDILYKFPFSKRDDQGELVGEELEGIAARSDFDLSQHERFSGKPMSFFDEELRAAWGKLPKEKQDALWKRYYEHRKNYLTKSAKPDETPEQISKQATEEANRLAKGQYIPHVIEPSAGVDRLILALIANAYHEEPVTDEKGNTETRIVMRFHPRVAPTKVGVFPLLKNKPELVKKALEVRDLLRPHMTVFYDEAGAIGRRYRRQDEAGTPFGLTIDFDTLGEKPELLNTVTLRERDSMRQTRVKIGDLVALLNEKVR